MFHQIGAALYVLWGVLHLSAAADGVRLARTVDDGPVRGRLMQNAWHLAVFSVTAMAVAVTMNWHNSVTGYWINLVAVSACDIGFILFVLLPKRIPLFPGLVGPVIWLLAAAFSTAGVMALR